MKFSTISALGGLLGVVTAGVYTQEFVCTDSNPYTVTETVTVTAGSGSRSGGYATTSNCPITPITDNNCGKYTAPPASVTIAPPPYVTTAGDRVTSVDYSDSKTSVWVYPTGSASSKDCTVAIYENEVVTVIIINISVTIVNGATTTITSTVTDGQPTYTPTLPVLPPSSTSSSSSPGQTHHVIVGIDGQLKYGGNQINASIGDIIRFDFNATNHTVTQSTLAEPCKPLAGGFDTGFHQNHTSPITGIIFRDFQVTDLKPTWFYCAQTKGAHCQHGMVLGVNPAGKFPEFISRATNTATSLIALSTGTGYSKVTATGAYPGPTTTGAYKYRVVTGRRAVPFAV